MKRRLVLQGAILAVLACGVGVSIGRLSNNVPTADAKAQVSSLFIHPSVTAPNVNISLSKMLIPVSQSEAHNFFHTKVHNAAGDMVTVSADRPVLMVASWCKWCHKTLQLLAAQHLLNHVQVVVVLDNGAEVGQKPEVVKSVHQEQEIFEREMKKIHVNLPPADLLYSLPTDKFDKHVSAVPLLISHYNGKWQELKGYVPNPKIWQNAIVGIHG